MYTRAVPTHVSTRILAAEDLREFIVAVLKSANVSNLKAQQEDGDLSRGTERKCQGSRPGFGSKHLGWVTLPRCASVPHLDNEDPHRVVMRIK